MTAKVNAGSKLQPELRFSCRLQLEDANTQPGDYEDASLSESLVNPPEKNVLTPQEMFDAWQIETAFLHILQDIPQQGGVVRLLCRNDGSWTQVKFSGARVQAIQLRAFVNKGQ